MYCDIVKRHIKSQTEKKGSYVNVEYDESANVAEVRKFGGMQFPMLKIVEDDGKEQGIFESSVITQVLDQLS